MLTLRNLIITTLLLTTIGCTENSPSLSPSTKAPFMKFGLNYKGKELNLAFGEKNEEQMSLLTCEKVKTEPHTDYCVINKTGFQTTAVWKDKGLLKLARIIFPIKANSPVDTQVRGILSGYGLTLEDFSLNDLGRLQAVYDGARANIYLSLPGVSPKTFTLFFSTGNDEPVEPYSPPKGESAPFFGYSVGQLLTDFDLLSLNCKKDPLSVIQSYYRCAIRTDLPNDLILTVVDNKVSSLFTGVPYDHEQVQQLVASFREYAGGHGQVDETRAKKENKFIFRAKPMNGNQAVLHVNVRSNKYASAYFASGTQSYIENHIKNFAY